MASRNDPLKGEMHALTLLSATAQETSLRKIGESAVTGDFAEKRDKFADLARRAMIATQLLEEMAIADAAGQDAFAGHCRSRLFSDLDAFAVTAARIADDEDTGGTGYRNAVLNS